MHNQRSTYLALGLLACCTACGNRAASRVSAGSDTGAAATHIEAPVSRDQLIVASDYAFRGLPMHAHAGWLTLRLVNTGQETHMLAVAPIPTGYTTSGFVDSLVHLRIAPNTTWWSGVDVVSPGDTAVITVFFPAGEYAVSCFVKSGDGALHVVKGMVGSFDVIAARDTGVAPKVDGVVTLTRDRVGVHGAALTSGVRTLRVVSNNPHPQDFQILKLLPGRSAQDALTWFTHRTTLGPAAEAVGGVSSIYSGQRASVTVRFTPGAYVLFFPVEGADAHPAFAQRTVIIPPIHGSPAE
jgi:hypothetical protein